ncbi:MAG: selenocysteine-specific translation elongation factor [Candidatus Methylomirabilia bacterium]
MSHLIVGTAGHIDHGKTTLVRALTGIDTDRLKEEKERGITIELGFAHLDLPGLPPVGIVDVPGHEKFVHHMVAGVAGIDLVLLVIAADEGIMPQTREHLDICRLLGVGAGLVVLTKSDLVEPDWLEMVCQEVAAFLAGSFLEGSPILPVSSTTGQGIPELRGAIAQALGRVPARETTGIARLPIDRIFTMKGFGTVVTGTLISGRLAVGENVEVLPSRLESRIRGIQVYGRAVDAARAGQRTAINLQGVEKSAVERGAVLSHPGLLEPSFLMDARLTCLKSAAKPLANRTRVRLHLGTSEILARVILLGRTELAPGEEAMVQFRLESPGVALPRDRFVIRGYSPVVTLGGGELVDTRPSKHRQFSQTALDHVAVMAESDPAQSVPLLVGEAGLGGAGRGELSKRLNIDAGTMQNHLAALVKKGTLLEISGTPPLWVHREEADGFEERALRMLKDFHAAEPLKPGFPKEELKSKFPTAAPRVFAALIEQLAQRGKLVLEQDLVRLKTHRIELRVDQELVKGKVEEIFLRAGLQTPTVDAVTQELRLDAKATREAVGLLLAAKKLVKITEEILVHEQNLAPLRTRVSEFLKGGAKMGMPEFKEISGVSRKYSVPILEYFDRSGLTIRVGDQRVLRRSAGA